MNEAYAFSSELLKGLKGCFNEYLWIRLKASGMDQHFLCKNILQNVLLSLFPHFKALYIREYVQTPFLRIV